MAADPRSPQATREWLVRLGHLGFDDFLLVEPKTLGIGHWTQDMVSDWRIATNNAPDVEAHFRDLANLQSAICNPQSSGALEGIHAAQQRLVTQFADDLLRAKAPPLYDALPWHEWDFSIVAKRFPLWKTRFLLAGDGTTVTMCRCRKSAGVYVLEPDEAIARYVERRAEAERVRRFVLLNRKSQAASPKLTGIPLPDDSVDLAIVGSAPDLQTPSLSSVIRELARVSRNVLLVENSPLMPALDAATLSAEGFVSGMVEVRGLGARPCYWRLGRR